MALLKIYTRPENSKRLFKEVGHVIKLIGSAALNCPEVPTNPNSIETVYCAAIDLIGIDYIIEVVAVKRPKLQKISEDFIKGLRLVYPNTLFSIYFNLIEEEGMANTPQPVQESHPLTMAEAINKSKSTLIK